MNSRETESKPFNVEEKRTEQRIRWIEDPSVNQDLPIKEKYRADLRKQLEEAKRTGASIKEIEQTAQKIINLDYYITRLQWFNTRGALIDQEEDMRRTFTQFLENNILNTKTDPISVMEREITCEGYPAMAERVIDEDRMKPRFILEASVAAVKPAPAPAPAPVVITPKPEPEPQECLLIHDTEAEEKFNEAVNNILTKSHFTEHLKTLEEKVKYYETERDKASKKKDDVSKKNYQDALNACNSLIITLIAERALLTAYSPLGSHTKESQFKLTCITQLAIAREKLAPNRGAGKLLELIDRMLTSLKKLFYKNGDPSFKEVRFFTPKTKGMKIVEAATKDFLSLKS